ncbi:hypothetical protein HII31_09793 [Pseudocercospora fuligena]|uniref:Uncharacterized protein n=1 Tax=Pseudocercospora fuligena TaxID=685502 RepID=A0A8H6VJC6_9PEZI|nr:hypothetical protein HII31_09793 [Pseudocercospora fuligena]
MADSSQPPPPATTTAPKSPPLAFEKTPNDALVPPIAPPPNDGELPKSPSETMGRLSPLSESPLDLQAIIEKQAEAIKHLHKAFAVERESWDLERKRFHNRIASLEQLLKNGEHHRSARLVASPSPPLTMSSPAKSPILSPFNGSAIVSPQARPGHATFSLPTIAEDENISPLAARRDGAPQTIELPTMGALPVEDERPRQSSVTFMNAEGIKVEEIPPANRSHGLSPPPPMNRHMAGHTPIKAPRPPTPPPQNMSMDGIEDTPTRHNTHINTLLTQHSDDEDDMPLKGPLHMPELPHQPDATNFTLDALTHRLEHIEKHPDADDARPMVYSHPTPGVGSPANEVEDKRSDEASPNTKAKLDEAPFAPIGTVASEIPPQSHTSDISSKLGSPDGHTLSPQEAHEAKVQQDFEQGGIRLKKKTSTNFGAPFGSLAGFPISRKMSHEP